jgi:hypothetical protein
MSGSASWLSLRYAACACGASFLRFANAGGSRITTSKRASLSCSAFNASKASSRIVSTATSFAAAFRATYSSAVADESTQVALAAPFLSAPIAHAPT